jgi:superfamily II DNA helicase RecQ
MATPGDDRGEALARLRRHFGHAGFRPGQEAMIAAVLGAARAQRAAGSRRRV